MNVVFSVETFIEKEMVDTIDELHGKKLLFKSLQEKFSSMATISVLHHTIIFDWKHHYWTHLRHVSMYMPLNILIDHTIILVQSFENFSISKQSLIHKTSLFFTSIQSSSVIFWRRLVQLLWSSSTSSSKSSSLLFWALGSPINEVKKMQMF